MLLLDRARFPRDKPCGGAVTPRAASLLAVDITPVIERTPSRALISLRHGRPFLRSYPQPLAHMTQRCRLDAHLAEAAAAAGADFRDGVLVREVQLDGYRATVRTGAGDFTGRAVAGADGANGVVARALGLNPSPEAAVALEGNLPLPGGALEPWRELVALDLGALPGGYGWVFPKGDHLNVGVGAWSYAAPTLRPHLAALCRQFRWDAGDLRNLRGHHLPMRRPGAPIVRGPALLLGDAAGLVDPLSGEGISTAVLSARLAAPALSRYLAEEAPDLSSYGAAVDRQIMPELAISRRLQEIFHCTPAPYVAALRFSDYLWRSMCRIVSGDTTYQRFRSRFGPLRPLLDGWASVARWRNTKRGVRRRARTPW